MEMDLAALHEALDEVAEAKVWRARAERRREAVNRYLWDEGAGLYFDYDTETARRRPYEFATTFYPLWVGLASPEQARRVRDALSAFEAPGGSFTSTQITGNQWDAPFGWAPLQMAAGRRPAPLRVRRRCRPYRGEVPAPRHRGVPRTRRHRREVRRAAARVRRRGRHHVRLRLERNRIRVDERGLPALARGHVIASLRAPPGQTVQLIRDCVGRRQPARSHRLGTSATTRTSAAPASTVNRATDGISRNRPGPAAPGLTTSCRPIRSTSARCV